MDEAEARELAEEPKVMKQVTFQDPDAEEKHPKKIRRRLKSLLIVLRRQMEFYFGDSNMSKDRFMKQKIEESPDGYVPLSLFMTFNKIKTLTEDMAVLAKALQYSEMLQVNEEKTMVRRTTPIRHLTQDEIDDRTVYVEGFPKTLNHEWFYTMFSCYGTVTYVSLPRFKSTNDLKGFAFVEFETCEGAAKAIEMLNLGIGKNGRIIKPEDKVGGSIKQSSNLKYLKKRAAREGIDVDELEAMIDEPQVEEGAEKEESKEGKKPKKKKKKKRRSTLSQMEVTTSVEANSGKADGASTSKDDEVAQKEATGGEGAIPKKSKKSKKRRKRSSCHTLESVENAKPAVSQDLTATITSSKQVGELLESGADLSRSSDDSDASTKKSKKSIKEVSEAPGSSGDLDGKRKMAEKGEEEVLVKAHESCGDSGDVKNITLSKRSGDSSESDSQLHGKRKRRMLTDKNSESSPAKIIKKEVEDKNEEGGALDSTEDSKNSKQSSNESSEDPTVETTNESDLPKDKNRKRKKESVDDAHDDGLSKPKVGKQSGQRRSTELSDQPAAAGQGKKKKRRHTDSVEDGSKRKMRHSQGSATEEELMQEAEEEGGKKKRRHQRKMQKLSLLLRIMSKREWFRLKQEYLSLQKNNMKKLKAQLQVAARNRNKQNEQNTGDSQATQEKDQKGVKETNAGHPPIEFVPNAILQIKSDVGMSHKSIKEEIPASVEVSYIDVKPGMTAGYIRCKDGLNAGLLLQRGIEGCSLAMVEGAAEKAYWEKLFKDRQETLSKTKRPKQRGKSKLLHRAQNPLGEIFTGQHRKFNDDHDEDEFMNDGEENRKERQNWDAGQQQIFYMSS